MSERHPGGAAMFAVFGNRAFSLLWFGQLISGMGSALTTLASSILVYRVTGSALSVGLMLIATAGPTILVGLLAGVFVDRSDRKRILLASDLLRAVVIFTIPFLARQNLTWLYVIVAVSSAIGQFFESAHASVLPELASERELSAANSVMAISQVGSTTVGFAAAGVLASASNLDLAFFANSATFLISAFLVFTIPMPPGPTVDDTSIGAIGRNLSAGLLTVRDAPILRSLFLLGLPVFLIFGLQNSLYLPFALKTLGGSEFEFGLQQAAEAIGIALGSVLMAIVADRIRASQWLILSFVLMALVGITYSLSTSMTLAIGLIGVSGFVNAPSYVGRRLVIQRATPREMRGRVNSAFLVVRDVMFVVGMSMAGLADFVSLRLLMFASAAVLLVAGGIGALLPGLALPAGEWRRLLSLLRGAEAAPRLGAGRAATVKDVGRFIGTRPELTSMTEKERSQLAADMLVAEAQGGKVVIYRGETSNAAYFILRGSVGVGYVKGDEYVILNYLHEGDYFGEVAALTGAARTANVIAEEDSEFLILPSNVLRRLADRYAGLKELFYTTMAERLSVIDIPLAVKLDQSLLRELRTDAPPVD
jgi:DHA3 family macrolide efflux protein-like MFS transporter